MSTLGERLKASRESKGLLQSELAKLIGVKSANVISNWEKDVSKPDGNKMVRICQVLDISLSYLLDYYGTQKAPSCSDEAIQLAHDYDGLDSHGKRIVRLVTDEEMERIASEIKSSKEQPDAAEEMPTPVFEGGLEDSPEFLMRYVSRLSTGQKVAVLDQVQKMIEPQTES